MVIWTSPVKIVLGLAFLGLASFQDYSTREIDDRIWLAFGALGGAVSIYEVVSLSDYATTLIFLVSVFVSFLIGLALYYGGLTGGADAKAIWALGLTFPYYPSNPLFSPILPVYPLMVLSILDNAMLLTLALVFHNVIRNSIHLTRTRDAFPSGLPGWKKIVLIATAIRVRTSKVDWSKAFPVEVIDFSSDPPEKRISLFTSVKEDVDADGIARGHELGLIGDDIWISQGIPLVIFFAAGFLLSLILGDLLLALLSSVLA